MAEASGWDLAADTLSPGEDPVVLALHDPSLVHLRYLCGCRMLEWSMVTLEGSYRDVSSS